MTVLGLFAQKLYHGLYTLQFLYSAFLPPPKKKPVIHLWFPSNIGTICKRVLRLSKNGQLSLISAVVYTISMEFYKFALHLPMRPSFASRKHGIKYQKRFVQNFLWILFLFRNYSYIANDTVPLACDRKLIRLFRYIQIKHTITKLQAVVCSDGRFRAMREALHRCDPPCIPYLGMYLTDLSFIEEGTPDFTPDGLLNFSKMRMVSFHTLIMKMHGYLSLCNKRAQDQRIHSIAWQTSLK